MRDLLPSTLEECFEYMGQPYIAIKVKDRSAQEIRQLKLIFGAVASRRGYGNLVWKNDGEKLYAF